MGMGYHMSNPSRSRLAPFFTRRGCVDIKSVLHCFKPFDIEVTIMLVPRVSSQGTVFEDLPRFYSMFLSTKS